MLVRSSLLAMTEVILDIVRLRVRRQIKRHHHFKADIPPHIKNTWLNAGWHGWVIKIFKPAHVRLVIHIAQVGAFNKYFQYRYFLQLDNIAANTCA